VGAFHILETTPLALATDNSLCHFANENFVFLFFFVSLKHRAQANCMLA
jgi:hypothetical protein